MKTKRGMGKRVGNTLLGGALLACSSSTVGSNAQDVGGNGQDGGAGNSPGTGEAGEEGDGGAGDGGQANTASSGEEAGAGAGNGGEPSGGETSGGDGGEEAGGGTGAGAAGGSGGGSANGGEAGNDTSPGGGAGAGSSASGRCDPLPRATGATISANPSDDLESVIADAAAGSTILLENGTYDVSGASYIAFRENGVTLRSASGDPEAVVVDGGYAAGSILNVQADDVTIAELTLQRAMWHPIHVTGGADSNTDRTRIYRVRVIDPGQQAIKINASAEGYYSDFGSVECSHIALTDAGRPNVTDCYTGGVDAHLADGWVIRDNEISGFWCEQGLSEHAVHFWNSGRDTVVERNRIVDCARGVGFGLGETGNGTSRDYGEARCAGASFVGHYGGVIQNNVVLGLRPELFASGSGFDSGVALEQACGTQVLHNTVIALETPFTSIEYRFSNTDVTIANNLMTHQIRERDGATARLEGNLENVSLDAFVDAAGGDARPAPGSPGIDTGASGYDVRADFTGTERSDNPDVGAYEASE